MRSKADKAAQTKAEFEEAFRGLYAQHPIEKITVNQVCERAGYHRGTFYLHFRDMYDLLETVEEGLLGGLTECVEACMRHLKQDASKLSLIAACKDVVLFYETHKAWIKILLGTRGDPSFVHRLKEDLKPLWRNYVVDASSSRSDKEIDYLLEYTLSGTLFMIRLWLEDPQAPSAFDMAHLIYDFSIKEAQAYSLG